MAEEKPQAIESGSKIRTRGRSYCDFLAWHRSGLFTSGIYSIASQVKYASDLIARAGLSDNKIADTPLELNVKLRPTDWEPLHGSNLPFRHKACCFFS